MSGRAWWVLGACIAMLAAGASVVAIVATPPNPDHAPALQAQVRLHAEAHPTFSAITAPAIAAPPTEISMPKVDGIGPGDLVATIAGETIGIYDNPGDATPRENWSRLSYYSNPRTFMGLTTKDVDGTQWILAQLPEYPNNTEGWIRADEVTIASTDMRVNVYLDEREVDLLRDDKVQMTSTAVVGTAATPTPLGTYFISDPVDLTASPNGIYGAHALGLSAYSETLETFKGALPQIALHGTSSAKYFGQAASNGCVRLPDEAIRALAAEAALGTPVVIHQSRNSATSAP
ncbi:L,D-transpeptidase [Demequina oxidasica]|uniref:L,D-transpeptidase n=1 Tax=Demequina oxidasica TaxID=676199 RepID=UPI0007804FA0|nr:L,D-transpeptidase [Demequina oxidasica]